MTMQPYGGVSPYGSVGAPGDATGVYPALAGYVPMDTGRRIGVALVDGLIGVGFYLVIMVFVMMLGRNSSAATIVMLVLYVILLALELWAMFAKSSRLSGVLMKATYVDVITGQRSGGKLFGKFLLQGLFSAISAGIAPLIMYFATVMEPLKRNWFDRTMGLMLVDHRTGRQPGEPAPAIAPPVVRPAVNEVQFPGVSVEAGGSSSPAFGQSPAWNYYGQGQPGAVAEAPHAAEPAWPSAPAQPQPTAQPPAWPGSVGGPGPSAPAWSGAAASAPAPAPAPWQPAGPVVNPIVETGGLITATPRSAQQPTSAAPEPAQSFAPPQPVVREMRSVDAELADRTTLAQDASLSGAGVQGPHATLDDGTTISLVPPTVIGRNPSAPGSHPDAVARAVADQLASKTHLLMGRDDQGAWVIDLHSTNGVQVIRAAGGSAEKIEAGRKHHLSAGAQVKFGQHTITVN